MSQQKVCELQDRLMSFGLNPAEWIVFNLNETIFAAMEKTNPEIILAGSASEHDQGWDWENLELFEIS